MSATQAAGGATAAGPSRSGPVIAIALAFAAVLAVAALAFALRATTAPGHHHPPRPPHHGPPPLPHPEPKPPPAAQVSPERVCARDRTLPPPKVEILDDGTRLFYIDTDRNGRVDVIASQPDANGDFVL